MKGESQIERITNNTTALLVTLLLVDSLHFVWARILLPYLPPGVSAMFVLAVGATELTIFNLIRGHGRLNFGTLRRNGWFFLAVGFLVAVSTNMNYAAVAYIDPGTAALLAKTGILFGIALGIVWLRDRLTPVETLGALVAVVGAFAISYHPDSDTPIGIGALLVLASTFMYALHAAVVKRYGGQIDFAEFFMFRLLVTAALLLLFTLGRGDLVWPDIDVLLLLILVGSLDVAFSRALYYIALRRLNMSIHSIVLTLSPVLTVAWSILLFRSSPSAQEIAGGLAVLAGIVIVSVSRARPTQKASPAGTPLSK